MGVVVFSRIPYERFLQHYSLILRSMPDEETTQSGQTEACNKENELIFDPLDVLYQKQLQLTPRRQSATAKKKLRRRAGMESISDFFSLSLLFSIFTDGVIENERGCLLHNFQCVGSIWDMLWMGFSFSA